MAVRLAGIVGGPIAGKGERWFCSREAALSVMGTAKVRHGSGGRDTLSTDDGRRAKGQLPLPRSRRYALLRKAW
jgi:hypothetical protein